MALAVKNNIAGKLSNRLLRIFLVSHSNRFLSNKSVQIATGYKPRAVEEQKCLNFVKNDSLNDNNVVDSYKPKFSMILPPPNVTGYLHLGHALMATIQDVICRKKRQQGYKVIWIPGTDHAGIATQVIVEKKLLKEYGKTRHQIGRKKFLEEILEWKFDKEQQIIKDLQQLGCTLNWKDLYFTMDKKQENAVNEAFIRLFDDGLIVRRNTLVNWSCSLESAVSDIEVENLEIKGPTKLQVPGYLEAITFGQIYDIVYKICDHDEDEIIVSTTRPETILGDVAIAVHPNDERYSKYINENIQVWHPFRKERIPIIVDDTIDPEFGTGAVKITPGHDKNDFLIAKRHGLKNTISCFTESGKIHDEFKDFANLPRFIARSKILKNLSNMNLYRNIVRSHNMILPRCTRSEDIIEYILKPQWFLKCSEISKNAINSVKYGELKISPTNFEQEWYRWLIDTQDWCISRQLWWGHQIPVYNFNMSSKKSIWIAAKSKTKALEKFKQKYPNFEMNDFDIQQDSDVLDTWFSSSLLPFSVFGWPNQINENYPLDLMVTGHDIIYFWVARMVMLGQTLTKQIPFRNILLNGIICDVHGRKMSKSLGNIILPKQVIHGASLKELKMEIEKSHTNGILTVEELKKSIDGIEKSLPNGIPECGTDALRLTLCSHNIKNHFINFDIAECYTNKLFLNKIWQATRFTLQSFENLQLVSFSNDLNLKDLEYDIMDKWILSRLGTTKRIYNQSFESYNFHLAINSLKTFLYTNFCDVYLETTKPNIILNTNQGKIHCIILSACLCSALEMLAPFTPFLSEELLQYLTKYDEIFNMNFINEKLEQEVVQILDICFAIRQFKSQNYITKKHEPKIHLFPQNNNISTLLCKYMEIIRIISLSNEIFLENSSSSTTKRKQFDFQSTAGHFCTFGITINEKFNNNISGKVSISNLKKLEKLQNELNKLMKTISNDGYKLAANDNVKRKHNEKLKRLEIEINVIKGLN